MKNLKTRTEKKKCELEFLYLGQIFNHWDPLLSICVHPLFLAFGLLHFPVPVEATTRMKVILCAVLALAIATSVVAGPCKSLTFSATATEAYVYNLDALTERFVSFS